MARQLVPLRQQHDAVRVVPFVLQRVHAADDFFRREWVLRPYAVGLVAHEPLSASQTALVLLILASVSFDGFRDTPAWAAVVDWLGHDLHESAQTLGLALAVALFVAVYLGVCRLIAGCGESRSRAGAGAAAGHTVVRIAGLFVLTLVPIAIAYYPPITFFSS